MKGKGLFIVSLIIIFLIGSVSALEFDNVLQYDDNPLPYGEITVVNTWGLGADLIQATINENGCDAMGRYCQAILPIELYQEGELIQERRFYRMYEDGTQEESNIRWSKLEYWGTVNDYETQCEEGIAENGTAYSYCGNIQVGSHEGWISFTEEQEFEEGSYLVKISGEKKPSWGYDWQIKIKGEWTEPWAIWGNISEGDDGEVILNSPEDGSTFYSNPVSFEANVTLTGGANVVNASLWTNETGTWELTANMGISLGDFLEDLLAYYALDESVGVVVDETGNLNGTNNGATRGIVGVIENAFDFDGSNDYVLVSGLKPSTNQDLTISLWVNMSAFSDEDIFKLRTAGSNNQFFNFGTDSADSLVLTINDATSQTLLGGPASDVWNDLDASGGWVHYVAILNYSKRNLVTYVNGQLNSNDTNPSFIGTAGSSFENGLYLMGHPDLSWQGDGAEYSNGSMDELAIFNSTINEEIISYLYNNGSGRSPYQEISLYNLNRVINSSIIWNVQACDSDGDCGFAPSNYSLFIDITSPTIDIEYPIGTLNYYSAGETIDLNVTITDTNLNSCWYNYNGTNTSFSCTSGVKATENITLESGNTNITVYANDSISNNASAFTSWSYKIFENNRTFNPTTYSSAQETYTINVTANDSLTGAVLIYDGTEYLATLSGGIYITNVNMPSVTNDVNKTFYWNFTYTGEIIQSHSSNQTISPINLSLCVPGNDVTYLNFSFKNEENLSAISAVNDLTEFDYWLTSSGDSTSYITLNTSENNNYAFCFEPPTETVTIDLTFKYSKSGYPLRTFSLSSYDLTNASTDHTLYLLGTADGIYTTIQVIEFSGATISGVSMIVERQFSGTWTTIEAGVTDSAGTSTFWLNPNFQHRITASKTGYTTSTQTISPSQSLYTMSMTPTTGNASYTSDLSGIKWHIYPSSGRIDTGLQYFNATVLSSEESLVSCKFELLEVGNTSNILNSGINLTNSSHCAIYLDYTTTKNNNVFGRLSIHTTDSGGFVIVDSDWKWIIIDIDSKGWRGLTSFFSDLRTLPEMGEGNEGDYNRIITFFLIMTLLLGLFMYFTGVELSSPGISLIIIWVIVALASSGGFLTFESGSDNVSSIMEQWGFFIIISIQMIGYILNTLRRSNE